MAGEGLPVEVACRVLGVSCAGFYAWRFRPPSGRAVRHAWLTDLIRQVHTASYGNYGAKRVHAELVLGRGILVGHNAVAMLLQRAGIAGRSGARKRSGIPSLASADDLVDRIFLRDRPNQLWLTDVTEHPTREGKVYCAVVLDAFSRRVVGWSISHNPTAALTCNALGMAIEQREAARGETVIHSDHGTQFTSWAFSERARQSGLVPSMGSIGDCYDNAMIEAFWSRMQVELLDTRRWKASSSQRDLRVHRDLPQPPPATLASRDANTD
jgi:putative transposase